MKTVLVFLFCLVMLSFCSLTSMAQVFQPNLGTQNFKTSPSAYPSSTQTFSQNQSFGQQNLLKNGSFEKKHPDNGGKARLVCKVKGERNAHNAAAADWAVWVQPPGAYSNSNKPSFAETQIVDSTHPSGGAMLHVNTRGVASGVFQRFIDRGPENSSACVWLYVVRGKVSVGLGNGGGSGATGMTVTQKGKWMRVQIPNANSDVNQICIYSCWECPDGAEYYIQSALVTSSPIEEVCCSPK